MASELLPGTWWLHGTRGCNVYLQRTTDGGAVIIDTGFGSNARAIRDEVRGLGFAGKVHAILLTHRHVDHAGAAPWLVEMLDVPVVAGRGDCRVRDGAARLTRDWRPPSLIRRPIGALLGIGSSHRPVPVAQPIDLECEVAPGILAIPAAGHTRGTLCYLATESGATFTGDLFISYRDHLSRSMRLANDSNSRYLQSLEDIAPRVGDVGLPGHGYPVPGGFREQFRQLADRPRDAQSSRRPLHRARTMLTFAGFLLRRRNGDGP